MNRLAAVLVVLLVSGCASSAENRSTTHFRASYDAITAGYTVAAQETARQAQALPGNDEAAALAVYAQLAGEVERARDDYARLATPREVAPEGGAVVRLLAEQVELLRRVAPATKAKDEQALRSTLVELTRSTAELAQARTALDRALRDCGTDCR